MKLKCVLFSFSYIGKDTNWTLANGSLNPNLFYSDKIHLAEKGNSHLSTSIRKSTEYFYDKKSYKMAVSFALSNADFPPLFTVSKLHLTFINAFFDRHISNTTTVKPFSRTVLRCSLLLRTNLCANCYVTHHLSLNLFRLKDILLIMFYVNLCHVILFLLYHQLML